MPTLDWVNRKPAEEAADRAPYRLLECFGVLRRMRIANIGTLRYRPTPVAPSPLT